MSGSAVGPMPARTTPNAILHTQSKGLNWWGSLTLHASLLDPCQPGQPHATQYTLSMSLHDAVTYLHLLRCRHVNGTAFTSQQECGLHVSVLDEEDTVHVFSLLAGVFQATAPQMIAGS